jgi:hypothetical protein
MATTKHFSGGKIPEGFASPFKRAQMEERNDDALACIATLSSRALGEVTTLAVQIGYPKHGPAYVTNALITKLLHNLGLKGGEYQEFSSVEAMPDVAILAVDYQGEATDLSRHVVWHHVRATADQQAFSYVIDPAPWVTEKQRMTADFGHLNLSPAWYIEVTPRGKGK